jgi:membrane associated rhomboid family serine protease
MVLPLSDAPNPKGVPFVTYTLIAVNVAVYLLISWPLGRQGVSPADPLLREYLLTVRETLPPNVPLEAVLRQVSAYDLFVLEHGFRPFKPEWIDLLTSIFLHGGFLHLFGNMLFLWIYGDNVEHRLGPWKYLICYVLTGVGATLFYTLFSMNSKLPLVGASGAISGVLGFYFLWFPRNVVRLFVFLFPFLVDVVTISARIVLGFYLLIDNLLPFLLISHQGGGGVAHGAHIGGFVLGLAFAWFLDKREVTERPQEYRYKGAPPAPPRESIRNAILQARWEDAARMYFALDSDETRRLLPADELLTLAEWLESNGHAQAALAAYRRHLRDYPGGPGLAEAHLGAGRVQLENLGQPTAAYQHFLAALDSDPSRETEAQARAALSRIAARQKYRLHRFTD